MAKGKRNGKSVGLPAINPMRLGITQHGMAQQTIGKMAKQPSRRADHPARPRGSALQSSSIANSGDGLVSGGHNVPRGYVGDDGNSQRGNSLFKGSTPLSRKGR